MEQGSLMDMDRAPDSDWEQRRRDKIAASARARRRNRLRLLAAASALVIVAGVAWAVFPGQKSAPAPTAKPVGDRVSDYNETMVSIPVASVNETARFYKWSAPGKTIRFFAVMGSDGQVRTAFDNAYCCYHKDLGERQEGAAMVCNLCEARYPVDDLNRCNLNATSVSQCCPADLPHTVLGKDVLMKKSDLEAGSYLFKG
jgi:uncharacterized membrane protein